MIYFDFERLRKKSTIIAYNIHDNNVSVNYAIDQNLIIILLFWGN